MMFYPIFIPLNTGNDAVYSFPTPVAIMAYGGLFFVAVGLVMLLVTVILDTCFEIDCDRLFKVSTFCALGGAILLIIALPLMLITGVKVE